MVKRSRAGIFVSPFHNRPHPTTSDQPEPNTAFVSKPHKKLNVHSVSGSTGIFAMICRPTRRETADKSSKFRYHFYYHSTHAASSCHVYATLFNTREEKKKTGKSLALSGKTLPARARHRNLWHRLRILFHYVLRSRLVPPRFI